MTDDSDNRFTRTYSIPAWMVWGVIALFVPLATTIGGVIVVDRNQMHVNTRDIGIHDARIARTEEKTKDILDALNAIRTDIKEIGRRMP